MEVRKATDEVLAHDGDGLTVGRHLQVATTDCKVRLAKKPDGQHQQ